MPRTMPAAPGQCAGRFRVLDAARGRQVGSVLPQLYTRSISHPVSPRAPDPSAPCGQAPGSRTGGALRRAGGRAAESAGLALADEASQGVAPHTVCNPRSCAHLESSTPTAIRRICRAPRSHRGQRPRVPLSLLIDPSIRIVDRRCVAAAGGKEGAEESAGLALADEASQGGCCPIWCVTPRSPPEKLNGECQTAALSASRVAGRPTSRPSRSLRPAVRRPAVRCGGWQGGAARALGSRSRARLFRGLVPYVG